MSKSKEEIIKEFNEKVEAAQINFESYVKDLMQDLSIELEKIDKKDKKRFEVELPDHLQEVWGLDYGDAVYQVAFNAKDLDDRSHYLNGLFFLSREEAEKFLKERRLLFTIQEWAKMKNDGWRPDWSDRDCIKYVIYHNGETDLLRVDAWGIMNQMMILPVFKTAEIARDCIEEFGDEIKEILL